MANKWSEVQLCCSCGLKSKAPSDKDGGQESDKKQEEEPQLGDAVWMAKLKFLQVACTQELPPATACLVLCVVCAVVHDVTAGTACLHSRKIVSRHAQHAYSSKNMNSMPTAAQACSSTIHQLCCMPGVLLSARYNGCVDS